MGEEVREAVAVGLPSLSEQEVEAQLCLTLLRCARFNLAKQYLTGQPCSFSQHVVVMSVMSEQEIEAQLCLSLLRCARFNLAKQYLTGQRWVFSKVKAVH